MPAQDCACTGRELQMKTHLDLFSGIGGFAIAAQACGYTTIGFCEKEKYAQQILKERFGAVLADADSGRSEQRDAQERRLSKPHARNPRIHPDIFTLNGADYAGVDLLTGGFPCQPFSVAGKRLGKADDRAIWPEMLRVIREAKPTWIIGENVAGIVTMELDNILSDLEGIGYTAWPLVIPACAVDARHRRDRVWIVAHAEDDHGQGGISAAQAGTRQDEQRRRGLASGCEDVADAERGGQSGQGQLVRPVHQTENRNRQTDRADNGGKAGQSDGRQLESAILRMADGIPEGLDSGGGFCQWPEEDPETPRVSTGVRHRAHSLRGLGNSIVPNVAYEIIMAIPPRKIALAQGAGMR